MGSFRSKPETTKHTLKEESTDFFYAVSHMCGWRLYMQDTCIVNTNLSDKKISIFGVFDGHGGPQVSKFVERHFVKQLEKNKNFKKGDYELSLKQTFLKMDEKLLTKQGKTEIVTIQQEMREKENASKYQEDSRAGCTANVVLITKEFIYVANSGDSRSVACIKGETKQLSIDHKPDDKIQYDRIKKAGGQVTMGRVNGNLNLSRAMGDLEYKTNSKLPPQEQMITANPDIKKFKNQGIDFIIMGCDGIWEVKSNKQMVEWVKTRLQKNIQIDKILEELLDSLLAKDSENSQFGMDNMSSILIKFKK